MFDSPARLGDGADDAPAPTMPRERYHRLRLVAAAVVPPAVAFAFQAEHWTILQPFVWLCFYPAVLVSALLGGAGSAVASTLISAAIAWYVFIPPEYSFAIADLRYVASTTVFVVMGLSIAMISGRLQRINRLAAETHRALQVRHAEVVAERKVANEARREAQQLQHTILETAVDAIITIDEHGIVDSFNPGATRMFGYPADEVIGQNVRMLMPPPYAERHDHYIAEYLRTGKGSVIGTGRELTALHKDGEVFPVHLSLSAIRDGGRRRFCSFIHDLTEAKKTEAELRQALKMEAVGALASGVAHDFNNLLMGVGGCAALAIKNVPADSPARTYLDQIKRSTEAGAAITRQLLDFTRKREVEPRAFEIDPALLANQAMLQRLLGEDVELELDLGAQGSRVHLDPGQLDQIVINLAANARGAMAQGGRVTIATRDVASAAGTGPPRRSPVVQYVVLSVTDTGCGMSEETRLRAFEPFFTTKRAGEGTGLGLSIVYGIVKAAGGAAELQSRKGEGTTVRIFLPGIDEPVARDLPRPEVVAAGTGPPGTILLVEDDRTVRLSVRSYLEDAGYRVIEACDGSEAIASVERSSEGIELLLTDMVLPGMSGGETARRITQMVPGIRVLYMSAYDAEQLVRQGRIDRGVPVLQKPFSEELLLERVRAALGDRPEAHRDAPSTRPPSGDDPVVVGSRDPAAAAPPGRTVVVVDDEPAARLAISDYLRGLGWEVIDAGSARQALEAWRRRAAPAAVLLTDYLLPDMTGDALAREFRATSSETPVVYMSGRADLELVPPGVLLNKPIDLDMISDTLERLARARIIRRPADRV